MPSPRLASVVGHRPATAPVADARRVSSAAHVGGVHEAPALIHRRVIEQPLDGPLPAPRQAFVHFALLFGHVDVDRRRRVLAVEAREGLAQRVRA